MKLFFDEDMGKGIPVALTALGFNELPCRIEFAYLLPQLGKARRDPRVH